MFDMHLDDAAEMEAELCARDADIERQENAHEAERADMTPSPLEHEAMEGQYAEADAYPF